MPRPGRPLTRVRDLDPDRAAVGIVSTDRELQAQHSRIPGVHHGVGDQLGHHQYQRLRHCRVRIEPASGQPRPGPPASPSDLGRIRLDGDLYLKHLHRSHHPY
jgi:hypothetical protein